MMIITKSFLILLGIPIQDQNAASGNAQSTSTSVSDAAATTSTVTGSVSLNARPGSMVRVPELNNAPVGVAGTSNVTTNNNMNAAAATTSRHTASAAATTAAGHSRNSSWDMRLTYGGAGGGGNGGTTSARNLQGWTAPAPLNGHSRTASLDMRHSRNSSVDLNKLIRNDVGLLFSNSSNLSQPQIAIWTNPLRVQIIKAHHNWISVAYPHFVTCYRLKDSFGWQLVFTSPYIDANIERLAINAKVNFASTAEQTLSKMIAISYGNQVRLWGITDDGTKTDIGIFNLNVRVEYLFFIGSQLVALSSSGKIGVWHAMTQHWQIQDMFPILSFDTAGSFLLLGCNNGSIYYIGMCSGSNSNENL